MELAAENPLDSNFLQGKLLVNCRYSNFQLDTLSLVLMSLFRFRTHNLDRKVPWAVKDQQRCKTGPLCIQCIRLLKLDLDFRQKFPQGTVQAQGH